MTNKYNYYTPATFDEAVSLSVAGQMQGMVFQVGDEGTNEDFEITSIKIRAKKGNNPGNLIVELYAADANDHPIGPILSTGVVLQANIPTVLSEVEVMMSSYILRKSTKYVWIFYPSAPGA